MGLGFGDDVLTTPVNKLLEDLAVDYAWLFLGPGKHISPHESVQRPGDGQNSGCYWGDATVAVKRFIEECGFEYKPDFQDIPDHISVELEFMQHLSGTEARAWQSNHPKEAQHSRNIQGRFVSQHLEAWAPTFYERLVQRARTSFYRVIAHLTRSFIEDETVTLTGSTIGNCRAA